MNILLIEDEDSIRSALVRALERDGHAVRSAASLSEARTLLAEASSDLVVSDLKLPDGDGLDLVGPLGVPFIMLSGYATFDDAVRALRCGAVDFFTKPVAIKDVRAAIARARPGPRVTALPTWSDRDTALAAVHELVARLPGRHARLAAAELVLAAPSGRIVVQADAQGVRIWLDGRIDWPSVIHRWTWLEAHGIQLMAGDLATVACIPPEDAEPYDDRAELLVDPGLVVGQTVQASGWRSTGSWLLVAALAGTGPFVGLDPALAERLRHCGASVRTAPPALAEPGVGSSERAGLLADDGLGPPLA